MPACCVLRVSSYQELLALEEHIGVVSTGLSEEAISKCVKTSTLEEVNLGPPTEPRNIKIAKDLASGE